MSVKAIQKLPGATGETLHLSARGCVSDPPSDAPPFKVGDVFSFTAFSWRFRVVRVEGDDVYFERMS